MKIYNYQFQTNGTNATVLVSIRTDKGNAVADSLANDELFAVVKDGNEWWLEDVTEEDF